VLEIDDESRRLDCCDSRDRGIEFGAGSEHAGVWSASIAIPAAYSQGLDGGGRVKLTQQE
jgi:hypothetical protein